MVRLMGPISSSPQPRYSLHEIWTDESDSVRVIIKERVFYESFLNSHVLVKRGMELRRGSLHESFLNYHMPTSNEDER